MMLGQPQNLLIGQNGKAKKKTVTTTLTNSSDRAVKQFFLIA
jgi:hypothetical protein